MELPGGRDRSFLSLFLREACHCACVPSRSLARSPSSSRLFNHLRTPTSKNPRPAPPNRPDAKDVVAVVLAGGASKNPLAATTAPAALSMGKVAMAREGERGRERKRLFFGGNALALDWVEVSCRSAFSVLSAFSLAPLSLGTARVCRAAAVRAERRTKFLSGGVP